MNIADNTITSLAKTVFHFGNVSNPTAADKQETPPAFSNSEHITITGNRIRLYGNWYLPVFQLVNVDGIGIAGNRIESSGKFTTPVFLLDGVRNVELSNNAVVGTFKQLIDTNSDRVKEISISENAIK